MFRWGVIFATCLILASPVFCQVNRHEQSVIEQPGSATNHFNLARAYLKRRSPGDVARFWRHAGKAIELEMTADSRVSAAVRSPHAKWVTHGLSMAHQMMSGRNDSEASRFKRNTRSYERRDRLLRSTISEEYAKLERGYSDRRAREEVMKSLTTWNASFHTKRDALAKMLDPRRMNMATFKGWKVRRDALRKELWHIRNPLSALSGSVLPGVSEAKSVRALRKGGVTFVEAKAKALDTFTHRDLNGCLDSLLDTASVCSCQPLKKGKEPSPFFIGAGSQAIKSMEALICPVVPIGEVAGAITELACMGKTASPLIVDLDDDGRAGLCATLMADGLFEGRGAVRFDLNGDGQAERTEWFLPQQDGLLVMDRDGDGVISSGRELFGTASGDKDGFACLRHLDKNCDGWVAGSETKKLCIWMDDGDGQCQPEELLSLEALGIKAISHEAVENCARVEMEDGNYLRCWDWWPDIRP